jgi:proline iminopeptidase
MVEDLEALRTHLQQEKLLLAGHSWGGMLAMAYAAAHPDRVDRLILIGSGGPDMEFSEWFGDNITARLRPEDVESGRYWREAAKHGVDGKKVRLEGLRAIAPAYFFDRAKGLAFAAQLPDNTTNPDAMALMSADLDKNYDARAGLPKLDRPVLIVHGHQDPVGDKTAEQIHALIRNSTLKYLSQCGHFPWIEQGDQFRAVIAEFLSR